MVPKWAEQLGKVFKHQIDKVPDTGEYRWVPNKCMDYITVDALTLQQKLVNQQVGMWDYIKFQMLMGRKLNDFKILFDGIMAENWFQGAWIGEDIINYLVRVKSVK